MTGSDAVLEAGDDKELAIDGELFGFTARSSLRHRHSIKSSSLSLHGIQ